MLRSFRRKEKSSWDVFILVLPGSWTTDQYTTQEALRNIFKQKQMKQESGPNSVNQLSQESSLVLLLKVFWPFWSKEHWGESRLGWGFFCVNYSFRYMMALSYLEEMDVIQPVWRCVCVLIADDCWVFNRCLLLFKQTVIPSVFMAFM